MDSVYEESENVMKLKTGISLRDLMSDEGTTLELDIDSAETEPSSQPTSEENKELLNYSNMECLGLDDEDTYNEEPFDQLATKMENLISDGKIKKRILREGVGEVLAKNGLVICDYNAYTEYNPEPFDSTYAFNRQFKFKLGSGEVLAGLDFGIQTMKISEKSQFLIHYDYAYGEMGCLDRVPQKATILFEVEVKNCLNTNAATTYHQLQESEMQTFRAIYDYAEALRITGNDLFKRNLIRQSIKEYNKAISKLESCAMEDYIEQEQQQSLLLKLYTNILIAYTKEQKPRRGCNITKKILYMVQGTSLKIPAKVYFNNARCLMMLGELSLAEKRLKLAKKLKSDCNEIAEEFLKLENLKRESTERERSIARSYMASTNNKDDELCVEFKTMVKSMLEKLKNDSDCFQYTLPNNFTKAQVEYFKTEGLRYNVKFHNHQHQYILRKSDLCE